ncbi:hypothetical protein F2Q68_00004889 [Brassica cretica]|uniref:Uncharacterized protein n=1 Tax=Brassica cretica TaxID=69181 RepID=A0A8S9JEC1_BRACR|nr:hypothetical protein F2Q68_00004889 [Brassica cretica]
MPNSISWVTTCMEEMGQDIARMQTHRAAEATTPASIDRNLPTSIDADPSQSNPMKSQPDSYTRAEIAQMFFYFSDRSNAEGVSGDLEIHRSSTRGIDIDRQAHQHIDRQSQKDIDRRSYKPRRASTKLKSDMSDINDHEEEISAETYATLVRHQFKLECLGDRLQRIDNTTTTMKDKWRRGNKAMRDFTGTWFN